MKPLERFYREELRRAFSLGAWWASINAKLKLADNVKAFIVYPTEQDSDKEALARYPETTDLTP